MFITMPINLPNPPFLPRLEIGYAKGYDQLINHKKKMGNNILSLKTIILCCCK